MEKNVYKESKDNYRVIYFGKENFKVARNKKKIIIFLYQSF